MVGAVKPGYASRNKWCLRCLLKTGNVKAEEIWVGSLFQTWDAVDEKDLEVAIEVFFNGADMVIEEGRLEWSWRCVLWKNLSKVQRLVVVQYLESSCGNFEIDSMAYREPVQAGQNWRDVAVPRLLCNNSSKGVLNQLKASKIWCGRASKKRITIVKAWTDYCHGHCFCWASVVRDKRMCPRARMWKYDALQISETCLSKDIWESR